MKASHGLRCEHALTTNSGQRLVTSPETEFKVVRALQQPLLNRETPFTTQDPATAAHRREEGEEGVVSPTSELSGGCEKSPLGKEECLHCISFASSQKHLT